MSQRELAKRAGLTQAQVSKAENGGDLTVSSLTELARALDLELMLVPRKFIPALEGLARSAAAPGLREVDAKPAYTLDGDDE